MIKQLTVSDDSLDGLMDDLQQFQASISDSLSVIEKRNSSMKSDTQSVMDSLKRL